MAKPRAKTESVAGLIGKTFSHYRILEQIEEDGNGDAFLSEDVRLGRKAVLKFLSRKLAPDAASLKSLCREVQVLAERSHPDVTVVLDIGSYHGPGFVVLDQQHAPHLLRILHQLEKVASAVRAETTASRQAIDTVRAMAASAAPTTALPPSPSLSPATRTTARRSLAIEPRSASWHVRSARGSQSSALSLFRSHPSSCG